MGKAQILNQLLAELIVKEKWADFLGRFIEVLRVNIFAVDFSGRLLIPPYQDANNRRYGVDFLTKTFGFDFSGQEYNMLEDFVQHGSFAEARDPFDFHAFAIPVKVEEDKAIAHLIVGPVILNRRWENKDYVNMAARLNLAADDLLDRIHEIRVVSFVSIKAILDLLAKVVKDIVELNLEMKRLHQSRQEKELIAQQISDAAQDLYATIHLDELLITVLDIALNLSQAECGSIMLIDKQSGYLVVKVSRGMPEELAQNARLRLGEGISGLAAQENTSFVISGRQSDGRIRHLLRRPAIRESMVVPLTDGSQRVFGVLNLHTERPDGKITANVSNLEHLSRLISTAIQSL